MKVVAIGEGMIEIAGTIGAAGRITSGGDVLNVAVALARLGLDVALLTALGRDPWSDEMIDTWVAEGIDPALILRHPTRLPGLYAIRVDAAGERSFAYWRADSAARALFALPEIDAALQQAESADALFLSGITLSLFDAAAHRRLAALASRVRARGGTVAFDGNYRAAGWSDPAAARAAFARFAQHATLALPTLDDERALHGAGETAETVLARWRAAGVGEVAVKLGADGALVAADEASPALVSTTPVVPVDTTGAGDAFGAGYLAARLAGRTPADAARFAHRLAGATIRHAGAIPPRDAVAAIGLV